MPRKEELNKELSLYLNTRLKTKPRKKKKKPLEEVPEDISEEKVHVIQGEMSWFKKFIAKFPVKNKEEKEAPQPVIIHEQKVEEGSPEFEKEDIAFKEEKKEGFLDGLITFFKEIFSSKEEAKEEKAEEPKEDITLHPETKRLIQSLIEINVDVLSKLTSEELDRYRRSEHYQKFKQEVEKFKELAGVKKE